MGLLCIPNAHKQNSDDHPLIKSAHALPSVSGQLYFVHTDGLGTPHAMTDRSATVVWTATYDPFGKATVNEDPDNDGKVVENNVRFPGHYFDIETGLYSNGARYYSPEHGRYLTADPSGIDGGLNTFGYAYQNPLVYFDPDGKTPVHVLRGAFWAGGRIGAGINQMVQATTGASLGVLLYLYDLTHDDGTTADDPSQCDDTDSDFDCDEWVKLLNMQYAQISAFKRAGGNTRLAELQHNKSVDLLCQDPDCSYLCYKVNRF